MSEKKLMLSNEYLRNAQRSFYHRSIIPSTSVPLFRSRISSIPLTIRQINQRRRLCAKDISFMSNHVNRRLLLDFDSSLADTSVNIFSNSSFTTKIFSLLSKRKRDKVSLFVSNGILVSQQRGTSHFLNAKTVNSDIYFKYSTAVSLPQAIASREVGNNFKNCNNFKKKGKCQPIPRYSDLDRYKQSEIFFTNHIFESLHFHPYRHRLYTGSYVLSHLHSLPKKTKIQRMLKKYNGKISEVAQFWWEWPLIKFE